MGTNPNFKGQSKELSNPSWPDRIKTRSELTEKFGHTKLKLGPQELLNVDRKVQWEINLFLTKGIINDEFDFLWFSIFMWRKYY